MDFLESTGPGVREAIFNFLFRILTILFAAIFAPNINSRLKAWAKDVKRNQRRNGKFPNLHQGERNFLEGRNAAARNSSTFHGGM
jgi:hypothetical protein